MIYSYPECTFSECTNGNVLKVKEIVSLYYELCLDLICVTESVVVEPLSSHVLVIN